MAQCPDGNPPPCARDRPAADPRRSIIIFPFANRTGDPARGYLSEASVNLLGLAIAQWQEMRVFDDERTASLMRRHRLQRGADVDFDLARSMARVAGVGTLVLGDIRREWDSLSVQAKVHDVRSGERLETIVRRAGWRDDPRPLFDSVAAQLLGISGAPPGERPALISQTTSSLEAYRSYLAGTGALQRFQLDSARQLLGRAVRLDSNFAIAYLRLRDADGWGGPESSPDRRRAYVDAAERRSASLPIRLRMLVAFYRAYAAGDFRRARQTAGEMLRRDSGDVEAWYLLGEAHYHHRATGTPHRDTTGNLGIALNAFRRVLTLDSGYVVAFQHLLDGHGACAENAALLCLADSAVYDRPDSLAARYGPELIAANRAAHAEAVVVAARAWAAAVPGSPRARLALMHRLITIGRYQQALMESAAMDRETRRNASIMTATALFMTGRAAEAVDAVHTGLRGVRDTTSFMQLVPQDWTVPLLLLAGAGGRLSSGLRLHEVLVRGFSDSVAGNAGLRLSRDDGRLVGSWTIGNDAGHDVARHQDIEALSQRIARSDTGMLRRTGIAFGAVMLSAFLASRDTMLLVTLLERMDTARTSTWRVSDGLLALERGDTARATMRVLRHFQAPAAAEFQAEQGVVRAFAWGELLARLGRPRDAIAAFERMDSNGSRLVHPGMLVRSWLRRADLYLALGDSTSAAAYYSRYVAARRSADGPLQGELRRARSALGALRQHRQISRR